MPGEIGTLLTRLANGKKGLVTREELLAAGLSEGQVDWRVQSGLLIPDYDGIYRLGHRAPNLESSYLAAVLACGEGALLSGRAAAHLYGLIRRRPPQPEVTTTNKREPPGVLVHRKRVIHPRDATEYRGIPVTTVPRTVADAAGGSTPADLALLFHEARIRYGVKPEYVEAVLARSRIRGAAKLRRVIWGDERVLLSELERGFIALLQSHELPLPQTNIPQGAHWVDCWWPEYRAHSRARHLPVSRQPARLGKGPATRAPSQEAGRLSPVCLGRRLRDAGRADRRPQPCSSGAIVRPASFSCSQ
jgi:hypothetical protein